jgi:hypothetical protein
MAIKGGKEFATFVAEQFVTYMETPKEQRKQTKSSAKALREPWLTRWFGWGPASLMIWWKIRAERQSVSAIKRAKPQQEL